MLLVPTLLTAVTQDLAVGVNVAKVLDSWYSCAQYASMERYVDKRLQAKLEQGRFQNVPPLRSMAMSAVRGKGNKTTEVKFRMALVRAGLQGWKLHARQLPGNPDFYFPDSKLAVFIDGCFWHGCPRHGHVPTTNPEYWKAKIRINRQRDRHKKKELAKLGITTLRMWEHALLKPDNAVRRVKAALRHASPSPITPIDVSDSEHRL